MTAKEESRKPKQEQGEGRHRPRFLEHMLMKVKPLSANRILANHTLHGGRHYCFGPHFPDRFAAAIVEAVLPVLRAGAQWPYRRRATRGSRITRRSIRTRRAGDADAAQPKLRCVARNDARGLLHGNAR